MKKLVFLIFSLLIISGCTIQYAHKEKCTEPKKEYTENKKERIINDPIKRNTYIFEKECNGHIYVICRTSGIHCGIQMIHSPNCSCNQSK